MAFDLDDWARRWSPGISPTDGATVADLYTADGTRFDVYIDARNKGTQEIAAFAQIYLDAVPDAVCTIRSAIREGDALAAEWTFAGTHTGDVEGWPARGEKIDLPGHEHGPPLGRQDRQRGRLLGPPGSLRALTRVPGRARTTWSGAAGARSEP